MKFTRRRVLGLLAAAAAAIGVPSLWIYRMKTYAGPVSDHFDGERFFDPDGMPPKSLTEVLRWQFRRNRPRHADPGIAFAKLPEIDVVLVSHGHYDHLDIPTLSMLAAKFSPRVITPL